MKRGLTPTEKAVGTGTYFIRTTIWFPDGSRVQMEVPWVNKTFGDQLVADYRELIDQKETKTNAEWEEQARKGLAERKQIKQDEYLFKSLPVIKDTDWQQMPTSRPQRGIIDSAREITFSRILSEDEHVQLRGYLEREAYRRGIGWTGVSSSLPLGEGNSIKYRFHTTWDSSD